MKSYEFLSRKPRLSWDWESRLKILSEPKIVFICHFQQMKGGSDPNEMEMEPK